jgi:uncharacterized protein (UPF0276 family)
MKSTERVPNIAGIGLRLPHIAEVVATQPQTSFLEIHPENFLANPHAAELLVELSRRYEISVHIVGISVGTASGIDRLHLQRIRNLIDRIHPTFVSGHLAWSAYAETYLNDLLPLPLNAEALRVVATHVREVQDYLGRPYLVENPASYVGFSASAMSEAEFLAELVEQTQCKLLCDVSNVCVSANNMGYDADKYIDSLPADAIAEIHLGGYTPEEDEASPGGQLLIDSHASPIADPAWDLYAYAIRRFGPRPTLIEWDNNIPPLVTLLSEGRRADVVASRAMEAYCAAAG